MEWGRLRGSDKRAETTPAPEIVADERGQDLGNGAQRAIVA